MLRCLGFWPIGYFPKRTSTQRFDKAPKLDSRFGSGTVARPDGQQQCVLFAFCCSKDESGRTPVRPLGESKSRDALNEPHVPFDFFFGPFFFFVAITLLLGF